MKRSIQYVMYWQAQYSRSVSGPWSLH